MRLQKICQYLFSNPIKPPPNPTGVMGVKLSQQEIEKLMNPLGFLQQNEEGEVIDQIAKAKELKELIEKFKNSKASTSEQPYQLDKNGMPPEVGFKVKGLEPTRYGDWIGRGRLTDF